MTTNDDSGQDDLVERVGRAMAHAKFTGQDQACAAITECYKDRADLMAQLEFMSKQATPSDRLVAERNILVRRLNQEAAEAAAMREALKSHGRHEPNCPQVNKDYGDPDESCSCVIGAALSPDAGKKLLEVVKAVEKGKPFSEIEDEQNWMGLIELCFHTQEEALAFTKALAAWRRP